MAKTAPPSVGEVLRELKASGSPQYKTDMAARYGIVTKAPVCGVRVVTLRAMAKRIGKDHRLADALWRSGLHDARMLATMVDDPALVTPAQMDRWAKAFDNWGLVDTACFTLFDRTPHAFAQIDKWAKSKDEYVKRAAFALLACAALHGHGTDTDYLKRMALMKRAATDERNFVKKGVSWALRAIGGKKSPKLRTAARQLAAALATSEDSTARWIGKDALRDFSKGKR
ncbi:MAG: DNA alkylation repair protein [Hyphomonadaceae bacterium JAD_PAG50586_4]|nr:MAG: DNA alkylation repair protein [Hyphomonadaceae bacterium JAD_PAG50586_4]